MKVTVAVTTYNQARFIRQAIESVLMQKTHFDFEILIGEDDSTDGTREIVKEYAVRHPGRIRLFLHDRKDVLYIHGRPTGRRNFVHNLKNARGQYIALLEGDDYWTSPDKLQKQSDFLDRHPECSLCFHGVMMVYEDGSASHPYPLAIREPVYTLAEFLDSGAGPATGSVMFRNGMIPDFPDWFYQTAFGDQPLFVLCAERGDMGVLQANMGAYRVHTGGRWSQGLKFKQRPPPEVVAERLVAMTEFCEMVNAHLGYRYRHVLGRRIAQSSYQLVSIYQKGGDWGKMRTYLLKAYRAKLIVSEFPWTFVLKSSLVAFFPFFYRFYRAMKRHQQSNHKK